MATQSTSYRPMFGPNFVPADLSLTQQAQEQNQKTNRDSQDAFKKESSNIEGQINELTDRILITETESLSPVQTRGDWHNHNSSIKTLIGRVSKLKKKYKAKIEYTGERGSDHPDYKTKVDKLDSDIESLINRNNIIANGSQRDDTDGISTRGKIVGDIIHYGAPIVTTALVAAAVYCCYNPSGAFSLVQTAEGSISSLLGFEATPITAAIKDYIAKPLLLPVVDFVKTSVLKPYLPASIYGTPETIGNIAHQTFGVLGSALKTSCDLLKYVSPKLLWNPSEEVSLLSNLGNIALLPSTLPAKLGQLGVDALISLGLSIIPETTTSPYVTPINAFLKPILSYIPAIVTANISLGEKPVRNLLGFLIGARMFQKYISQFYPTRWIIEHTYKPAGVAIFNKIIAPPLMHVASMLGTGIRTSKEAISCIGNGMLSVATSPFRLAKWSFITAPRKVLTKMVGGSLRSY